MPGLKKFSPVIVTTVPPSEDPLIGSSRLSTGQASIGVAGSPLELEQESDFKAQALSDGHQPQ